MLLALFFHSHGAVAVVDGFEPVPPGLARDAEWVARALRRGRWEDVAGVVPSGFDAYVAVLHPASRCVCTAANLAAFQAGHVIDANGDPVCRPIRWSAVAGAALPVVYGQWQTTEFGVPSARPTQYRRLADGDWVVDRLDPGSSDIVPLVRPGDAWIYGPTEGTLPRPEAEALASLLRSQTPESMPCWFGIWDGFGWLDDADRQAAAIDAPARRFHLFRAPITQLPRSFDRLFDAQTANLVWPNSRSWCLATEIDSEVTYIGGTAELVSAIRKAPNLETRPVAPGQRLLVFHDVLQPVVEAGGDAEGAAPGFAGRAPEFGLSPEAARAMHAWIADLQRAPQKLRGGSARGGGSIYRSSED